jgi:hypothetical protein
LFPIDNYVGSIFPEGRSLNTLAVSWAVLFARWAHILPLSKAVTTWTQHHDPSLRSSGNQMLSHQVFLSVWGKWALQFQAFFFNQFSVQTCPFHLHPPQCSLALLSFPHQCWCPRHSDCKTHVYPWFTTSNHEMSYIWSGTKYNSHMVTIAVPCLPRSYVLGQAETEVEALERLT